MKNLFIGLLTLTSLSAFAHPKDTDPATAIDVGSIFKLTRDVNIPSFNKILFKDGVEYRFYSEVASGPFCRLWALNAQGNEFEKDIRIKGQSVLTVVSNENNGRNVLILTKTINGNFVYFQCHHSMVGDRSTTIPSIGEVRQSFKDLMKLNLPDPTDI